MRMSAGSGGMLPFDLRRALLGSTLVAAGFMTVASPAFAQSQQTETTLSTITVIDETEDDNDTYVATQATAATKDGTPLIETPRSVDVITRKEMDDRLITTVKDAVSYSSGVTIDAYGYDPRFDQISIRGYPVHIYGDYRDGLRQMTGVYGLFQTEPYGLERIEILKGPASVLYGQSTPGGIVNSISKAPKKQDINEVFLQYTDTERGTVGFDFNRALTADKTWMGRVVGFGQLGETTNDIQDDRFMLAPSLRWQPTENTDLKIYALGQHDEGDTSVTLLNRNGKVLPYRTSDPEYDHQLVDQFQLGYALSHKLDTAPVTLKQNARLGYFNYDARYLTGSVTGGGWISSTEYARGRQAVSEALWSAQVDNQLHADVKTGLFDHKLLAGLDYMWSTTDYRFGSSAAESAYTFDITNPVTGLSGSTPAYTTRDDVDYNQAGIYFQDRISFGKLRISGGLRYDYATRERTKRMSGTSTRSEDEALTYNIGLLYAFDMGLSPYVSWSTSFLPSTYQDSTGGILKPTEGEQYEAGIKFQPPGSRTSLTASVYRLTNKNIAAYAGYNSTVGYYYESLGEVSSNGVELEARTSFDWGLDVIASYTLNDAEITKGSYIGNRPAMTPVHSGSLWLNYTFKEGFAEGLSIGAGARYVGETFGLSNNLIENDPYTIVDASLRYDLGGLNDALKGAELALNVTDLTDERPILYNNYYYYQTQGRTISARLKYTW